MYTFETQLTEHLESDRLAFVSSLVILQHITHDNHNIEHI